MRISAARRRRRRLSMTSLIDVIFLLLLFFMLSSTFTRFAEIDIVAGGGGEVSKGAVPDIFLRLDADAGWKVNGAALPLEEAMMELQRLESDGAETAVLTLRDNVTSQMLVDALERIARSVKLKVAVAG